MTKFINHKPASNFHHAIRIAEAVGYPLNLFVSINLGDLGYTECSPAGAGKVFQQLRERCGKWLSRPRAPHSKTPSTWVYVLECPNGSANCHWLLHVPAGRHEEFEYKLHKWLYKITGNTIYESTTVNIKPAPTPRGAGKYMLKGMHPHWASQYDIRHEPQGEVYGRRSGFSKNIGPTQKRRLRAIGKYPKAKTWVSFLKRAH